MLAPSPLYPLWIDKESESALPQSGAEHIVEEKKEGAEGFHQAFGSFEGRDDKTRTCDLAPPRRVRYQLRYIPFLTFVGAKV